MITKNLYLHRYAYSQTLISEPPHKDLRTILVIPSFAEKQLIDTLVSIHQCQPTRYQVEVIIVINHSASAKEEVVKANQKSYQDCRSWIASISNPKIKFHLLWADNMPEKDAGVGLARKIGMDEAVRRFEWLKNLDHEIHHKGIIVNLDADCRVDQNYLSAIEDHFEKHPESPGAVIYYEHPIRKNGQDGIISYELFLRYYVDALRYCGYPFAYQTVGSCMAVRSIYYQKQGGMNKRKAGEDFYFLQKIFPIPGFTEINETSIVPSPRISTRVPFGTGKAMLKWSKEANPEILAYAPEIFQDLKQFLHQKNAFYKADKKQVEEIVKALPQAIQQYLLKNNFSQKIKEINNNTANPESYNKRFYQWLNGFRVLKYVHFARDQYYPSIPVKKAATWLLREEGFSITDDREAGILALIRQIDRSKLQKAWHENYKS